MGTLYYGGSDAPIRIEDRTLAHLKIVITTKLRRGESFQVSWTHRDDRSRGRSTIWLHPAIPLRFVFDDPEPPELDRQYLVDLADSANAAGVVHLDPDDVESRSSSSRRR